MPKLLSWNVGMRGLRKTTNDGYLGVLADSDADIVCLQETKLGKAAPREVALDEIREVYPHEFWGLNPGTSQPLHCSGTCIFTKQPAIQLDTPEFDQEGRIVAIDFPRFAVVNVYTPNSQSAISARHDHRVNVWDPAFREYVASLNANKPVILCGDFNVARHDIDVAKPDDWENVCAGFLDAERRNHEQLLEQGWYDSYRIAHPQEPHAYTYWDQKIAKYRSHGEYGGWRIDYVLMPKKLVRRMTSADIHAEIMGSDHSPVSVTFEDRPRLRLKGPREAGTSKAGTSKAGTSKAGASASEAGASKAGTSKAGASKAGTSKAGASKET